MKGKRIRTFRVLCGIVILGLTWMHGQSIPTETEEKIHIVTEELRPYNYEEDGDVKGVATAIVQASVQEAGIDATIMVYPWIRAYNMALREKNVLIYPITRSEKRENLFKWVGVVADVTSYLIKLNKRNDIHLETIDDVKQYNVGTVRGWISSAYLTKKGIAVEEVTKNIQNIKKLKSGRIDLLEAPELTFLDDLKQLGYAMDEFEFAYKIDELSTDLYMAFSQQTSDELVERVKKGLSRIKANGTHEAIHRQYFK